MQHVAISADLDPILRLARRVSVFPTQKERENADKRVCPARRAGGAAAHGVSSKTIHRLGD